MLQVLGVQRVEVENIGNCTVRITVDGGADADIAEALWRTLPVYVATVGSVRVEHEGLVYAFERVA